MYIYIYKYTWYISISVYIYIFAHAPHNLMMPVGPSFCCLRPTWHCPMSQHLLVKPTGEAFKRVTL